MDLRSLETPWGPPMPTGIARGPLEREETCDVLVVGSGMTGAMIAYHLALVGADVVVVDRRPYATGSTVVTTALVQYELDVPMVELIPRMGLADAQAAYHVARGALDDMRQLIETNGFQCDFAARPSLYLARDAKDLLHLQHETIARGQIGIDAKFLTASDLESRYRIKRPGAIRSAIAYEMDPRELTVQLLAAAERLGARLYDRTRVAADPWVGATPTLRTDDGYSIHCKHIVYATGYEAVDQFPALRDLCTLRSTYGLATHPVDPERLWPERALLWEYARPYFYARTTRDNRIIVGGEDDELIDPEERDRRVPAKSRRLLEMLAEITGIDDVSVDREWGATFAETADGLPFIGAPDCARQCYLALGYSGNGILFGLIGAQVIRDAILGRHHPASRLFGFDRPSSPRPVQSLEISCP